MAVLDTAQDKAHREADNRISNEEEAGARRQVGRVSISVEVRDDAGISNADEKHEEAKGRDRRVDDVGQAKGHARALLRRSLECQCQSHGTYREAEHHNEDGVVATRTDDCQSCRRAKSGGKGSSQGKVARTLSTAMFRNDGLRHGHDGSRRHRITQAMNDAHDDKQCQRVRNKIRGTCHGHENQRDQEGLFTSCRIYQISREQSRNGRTDHEGAGGKAARCV